MTRIPHARWNFTVLTLDFAIFGTAMSFMSWVTIFPAFLKELGADNIQIGLLGVVTSTGFALPPLFVASYTERLKRKSPFVIGGTIGERLPSGILCVLALAIAVSHPGTLLWIALGLVFVQTMVGGALTPAWLDLLARAIHARARGRYFGLSNAIAGGLGFLGSFLAQRLLDHYGFPRGYAACFGITFCLFMVSFIFLALNKEVFPEEATSPPVRLPTSYPRMLIEVLRRQPNFRVYLGARCLAAFAGAASGFFTVFALARVPEVSSSIGLLTSFLLGSTAVSNLIWGHTADHVGHKMTLIGGQLLIAMAMIAELFTHSLGSACLAFVLLGAGTSALNVSGMPMTLEFAPPESRPTYVGLASFSSVPFLIAGPLIGGFLADAVGYDATFALYLALGLASGLLMAMCVKDPHAASKHGFK